MCNQILRETAKECKITSDETEFVNKDTLTQDSRLNHLKHVAENSSNSFLDWLMETWIQLLHSITPRCPDFPGIMSFAYLSEPKSMNLGNASFISIVFHTF